MAKRKVEEPQVPVTDQVEGFALTPEEIEAVKAMRTSKTTGVVDQSVGIKELAQALIIAIESTRPPQKKNPFNRKKLTPWMPKDGSPKPKLKRAWFQHGMELDQARLYPEEVELLNLVKPGRYVGGLVVVTKRKDRGYDISWPVRTASQRLRVINEAGSTFPAILQRCIDEHNNPARFRGPEDDDDE